MQQRFPHTAHEAAPTDLPQINAVIQSAITTWHLPERVRRLTAPLFEVDVTDMRDGQWLVTKNQDHEVTGVAHWTRAIGGDLPDKHRRAAIVHSLYVKPDAQHRGLGTALLGFIERAAREESFTALVVRAQRDAEGFFTANGFRPLRPEPDGVTYPRGLWRPVPALPTDSSSLAMTASDSR